jgi:hypothetical protein
MGWFPPTHMLLMKNKSEKDSGKGPSFFKNLPWDVLRQGLLKGEVSLYN